MYNRYYERKRGKIIPVEQKQKINRGGKVKVSVRYERITLSWLREKIYMKGSHAMILSAYLFVAVLQAGCDT